MVVRQQDIVSDMVPRLPGAIGVARPAHPILEHAPVPAGVKDAIDEPLHVIADDDRWRRSVHLARQRVPVGELQ